MNKHFQLSADALKKELLTMGAMVEATIARSIRALRERNVEEARKVIHEDDLIDRLEVKIEEDCLKVLALYQPVAEDLRFVSTVMKINNDLERIADLSVNIARRAKKLAKAPALPLPELMVSMADATARMLRDSLKAFVDRDSILSKKVCIADDEVDGFHREIIDSVVELMKKKPESIELYIHFLWCSRNLERIADHVTNIAEDVVYMVDGEIIRHSDWESKEEKDPSKPVTH